MTIKDIKFIYKIGHAISRWYFLFLKKNMDRLKIGLLKLFKKGNPDLKKIYNLYSGEKCFIVCTGPSLTIDDLEMIKNHYSFSMNSIIKLFDQTSWRPDFYGIQDQNVYDKLINDISTCKFEQLFISDHILKKSEKPRTRFLSFPLYIWGHNLFPDNPYFAFSDDISIAVSDGFSITYSLLQIACYMGFKSIYLLGCDNSYNGKKQHVVESGHIDINAQKGVLMQREAFKIAKNYADFHGIKIFNATRGGELEIFPRMNLEEAIRDDF